MVVDTTHTEEELLWEDEVNDEAVDNLVRLIQEGHRFNKSMFGGGLTAADLARMRAERNRKRKKPKIRKKGIVTSTHLKGILVMPTSPLT